MLSVQYIKGVGFTLLFNNRKGRSHYFISDAKFCCEDFNFADIGLILTTLEAFVLLGILNKKKQERKSWIFSNIDFKHNVECLCFEGYFPYVDQLYLVVKDGSGEVVSEYPLALFNVDGDLIGYVDNAEELVDEWNNDADNQQVGQIEYIGNDFVFKFIPV